MIVFLLVLNLVLWFSGWDFDLSFVNWLVMNWKQFIPFRIRLMGKFRVKIDVG